MKILLTNDDGIAAPGIAALCSAVSDLGEVTVVAPDSPQSAVGRSITIDAAVSCREAWVEGAARAFAASGRPTDCVKIAVRALMPDRPDLVLAGINDGANIGINVFYSGTVAAAAEGALLGMPSVAFSLARGGPMLFPAAAKICRRLLEDLLAGPLAAGELINVNIPNLSAGPPRGLAVVHQGTAALTESYHRHPDHPATLRFQLADDFDHEPEHPDTDVAALKNGFVTLTPLARDLTDLAALVRYQSVNWRDWPGQ